MFRSGYAYFRIRKSLFIECITPFIVLLAIEFNSDRVDKNFHKRRPESYRKGELQWITNNRNRKRLTNWMHW